ncbi:MAG: 4Fe-4S dicluster domain-containing protein [Candidatus Choladocola sp.]|nr:4Fe-4S dicluster domain-containing protein [Candidatus Choladocola sp.]
MFTSASDINDVKQEVLRHVAKLAFEGTLEEKRDNIPYEMLPGPKATFRCCVYREREIIRQRVRLAEGKYPAAGLDNHNIVQVLDSACAECPIQRYVVTDNCQKCLGKKCLNACKFGAISIGRDKAYIDPDKCRECGKCAQSCPYNAISDHQRPCKKSCPVGAISTDEHGIVTIDDEKCIHCGACIKNCPFGALSDISFIVPVIKAILKKKPVYAMVAPAAEGQLGKDITMGDLREALKELGFTDMYEVALGADLTAESEGEEWLEAVKAGQKKTTSCCPAFVGMVQRHFPQLEASISTTISPMAATSRYIKAQIPNAITVFIGPCVAKKSEVLDQHIEGNADYVLTLKEVKAMMDAKEITVKASGNHLQQGSMYGRRFAHAGGVTEAVLESLKEKGIEEEVKVFRANGAKECKKALTLLKSGRLPETFIEGMACEGGCVNGPGSIAPEAECKKFRDALQAGMDDRRVIDTVQDCEATCTYHMHRS